MNVLVDGEIVLYGTVGEGFFTEGFTAMDVVSALAEIGRTKDVAVRINSGGGIATEGLAIYNALDSHRGKVTVFVESIAASAASIIAMAGDEIVMRTGAVMMVHDPATFTAGNSDDHTKTIEMLETLANSMAEIYAEKTGRSAEEARAEMKSEVWMTPREAVAKGYADKVEKGGTKEPTAFDYRLYRNAPARMVALAESRSWNHSGEEADVPAVTESQQETPMADTAAAGTANTNAEITPEPVAPVQTETTEQITARVEADVQKRAADIYAACSMVGKADKATAFISEGKSLSDVIASLQAERASESAEITARNSGRQPGPASAQAAGWDKAVARANARIGAKR